MNLKHFNRQHESTQLNYPNYSAYSMLPYSPYTPWQRIVYSPVPATVSKAGNSAPHPLREAVEHRPNPLEVRPEAYTAGTSVASIIDLRSTYKKNYEQEFHQARKDNTHKPVPFHNHQLQQDLTRGRQSIHPIDLMLDQEHL